MSIINIDQIGTNRGDEVWTDLNVGNVGVPVYIENGIPKPCNIIDGEEGAAGVRGIQGKTGMQGLQGIQGKTGPAGTQGAQGRMGVQGIQGRVGPMGFDGYMGSQGVQGKPGKPGIQGLQGTRGCTGAIGADGTNGSQGAQGRPGSTGMQGTRGCTGAQGAPGMRGMQGAQGRTGSIGSQGAIGYQGLIGVQGLQGARGGIGSRGTMGYQGQEGPVGIQGLVGENGAIWSDGIRLNGYNTHLFEYDSDSNKFVSRNENEDLLYLKNGARIDIWLDESAYNAIKGTGNISIDRLENGDRIYTKYPVYYSGVKPLSDVITPANDLDTVVELTFRDGAWYYSGGLLTPTITNDIIVAGVELGQLHEGALIEAGTTIQELFTRLLVKEIDVHGVNPITAIKVVSGTIKNGQIYEVGTSVIGTLGVTYTDGKFVGNDGYNYSEDAKCNQGVTTYYKNGSITSSTININGIGQEDITFRSATTYSESETIPRTNVGNLSTVKIASGSVNSSNNIMIKGRYKMFYGYQIKVNDKTIKDPDYYQFITQESLLSLSDVWISPNSSTTIASITSTIENPSFVIVIPSSWTITNTENSLGQSVNVATTWYKQNTITYSNNDIDTEYQVYVSPSTEATVYKNIIINK